MNRVLRLWSAVSWWLVPLAIAVFGAVDLAQNGSLSSSGSNVTFPGPVAAHAVFLLLVTVPLCWRSAPATVAIVVTVAAAAWDLVMSARRPSLPSSPGWRCWWPCSRWPAESTAGASGSRLDRRGLFLAGEIRGELAGQGTGNVLPAVVFYVLIFMLGRMVHAHRRHASGQQDRAERLEREQEALAARAVATERSRIARELHDVIAHSLSVIVVQAAAERRVLGPGRDSTAETLESIEQAGRQAMTELRRLLGLLRKSDGELSLAPQPGLGELGDLVAGVREAGVEVDVRTDGDLAVLPRGLDLTAYRIVQECLTNVLKHAGADRVEVSLRCLGRCLDIDVTDDGTSARAPSPGGFGLVGMRERVSVYGGTVQAGHREGGGFRVHARLPVEAGDQAGP